MSTEAKCPFIHTRRRRHVEPRLVAEPVEARPPAPAFLQVQSDGRGLQLRGGVQEPRPGGGEEGSRGADDRLAGLVAGGLRPLRPVVHSHGVAQRRHVPHRRRPRRRRPGPAALRAAQQLAGQRQPGQGAPAALADQAEVRPQDFLGRPDDPRRQRRARNDGIQDLRFRRRARGRLGAGSGRLLGRRDEAGWSDKRYSGRPGSRKSAGRRADGADLRQSRKARTATRIRSRRPRTSARRSRAWR